jgi:hypothetical protein
VLVDWLNSDIFNGTKADKGTDTRTLCQKIRRSVEVKHRPIKMDSRTIYRALSSEGTPFKTGVDG